ncbi:MAG: valine--tRNA ligase [Candidatus Pacebacteria bacterium]|nr:valine--tRNA ligase [Candidatus Paceibacterota bacterium]
MDSKYNYQKFEQEIYKLWEDGDHFSPDNYDNKGNDSFCIMMPPPNANDPLHIGHAMFIALEDIMIRFNRMKGKDTLWLPGTDHAGIETQFVFEKKLKKKKQSRFDFDRETLFKMIWDYVQDNSQVATNQMKKIGASADWDRFKFMLDPEIVKIVLDTFTKLHDKDLVYRSMKLVNYCTRCGTSYSELEVDHQDQNDPIYKIQYGQLQVSTVRPETIFGDVALAVHPDDKRYAQYVGQKIKASFPWGEVELPVIADDYVKMDFGTGVLKITPYHDPNDWEVWQRHLDEVPSPIQVVNTFGKLINVAEEFKNLGIINARKEVVKQLKEAKLLIEEKRILHSVGTCYRCHRTIEPLPLPQFFIKVKPLVEPILKDLKEGNFTVHGAGHDKILKHWLENLKDWNISRQIVWGIRLPVWYNVDHNPNIQVLFVNKNKETINGTIGKLIKEYSLEEIKQGLQSLNAPEETPFEINQSEPQGGAWIQESDTFDTWFSSAQWPFTTLQSSKHEEDFARFYPTQVMETGYDILPFWVMRMLMIGKFATGKLPFSDIYLHGLVRDQKGLKMSKSKGNVINPLEIIEKYSADALRMALVIRSSAGLDKSVGEGDFKAMRNFTNKIWNAARYVHFSLDEEVKGDDEINAKFNEKITQLEEDVTRQLNDFKLGLATETLYNEFWHWYCDECIENTKQGQLSSSLLKEGLKKFLILLHPFVPFVTEAIWSEINKKSKPLIAQSWPL